MSSLFDNLMKLAKIYNTNLGHNLVLLSDSSTPFTILKNGKRHGSSCAEKQENLEEEA